jgi:hypothetical protein
LRIRAALAFTVLLAGCAAAPPPKPVSPELFVVVPGKDGHIGSIVVTRNGDSRVIATAFGAQRIEPDGSIVAASMTRDQVHDIFASTVDALPGRPTSFTLYFLEGKDELTPDSRKEMDKVFGELAYNDKLSLARAERLREMLLGMGIGADRVVAAGRGKRELLVPTDDNVPEARNRRVEINVR